MDFFIYKYSFATRSREKIEDGFSCLDSALTRLREIRAQYDGAGRQTLWLERAFLVWPQNANDDEVEYRVSYRGAAG